MIKLDWNEAADLTITGEKKLLPERQGPSAALGIVNEALARARDHACHTIHRDHLPQVLIGFDLAAAAACDALRDTGGRN